MIMFTNKTIIVNKQYYDKSNCKFILCDSCWWFATILKDVFQFSYCPRCKKKKEVIYWKIKNRIMSVCFQLEFLTVTINKKFQL